MTNSAVSVAANAPRASVKPKTLVDNFIDARLHLTGLSRVLDYEVVPTERAPLLDIAAKMGNGGHRELKISFVDADGIHVSTQFSEERLVDAINHPLVNKFDKMTLTAGLCALRMVR